MPEAAPLGPRLGVGRTAEVFAWGEGQVLKLFHADAAPEDAEHEFNLARAVSAAGAPAPGVAGLAQVNGRTGIIYERIAGPTLVAVVGARPWRLIHAAHQMAALHAQMHTCRPAGLPAQSQRLRRKIEAARPLSARLRQAALRALAQLPEGEALCHGDFHPDNIVLTARGPVILDWADAACGHPLADVARTSLLMQHAVLPPGMPGRRLIEASRRLWHHLYLRRYCQLRSVSPAQVRGWCLPVFAARLSEVIPEETAPLLAELERLAA